MKKPFVRTLTAVRSIFVFILTLGLCGGVCFPAALVSAEVQDGKLGVLWSTSFESGETAPTPSPVEGRQENTGLPMEEPGVIPSSITSDPEGQQSSQLIGSAFDGSLSSKFLTANTYADIRFQLDTPIVIKRYFIGSADDSGSSQTARDPKNWTFEGSNDGTNWTVLDTVTGNVFRANSQLFTFAIPENTVAYDHYRLNITENNGAPKLQISEIGWSEAASDSEEQPIPVPEPTNAQALVKKVDGKLSVVSKVDNAGWDGVNVLKFAGTHIDSSKAAKSYISVYQGLEVPVSANTQLSYMVMPQPRDSENYDFNRISNWISLDLKFTDGSYLSDMALPDRDGNVLSPMGQGDGQTLVQFNWNHIVADLGAAAGKTISEILVGYDNRAFGEGAEQGFLAYFDSVEIANVEAPDLTSTDYAKDYVDTLRGTYNGNNFSRGNAVPSTTLPHGFNQLIPVTEGVNNANQLYHYQQSGTETYAKRGGGTVTKNNNTLSHICVNHFTSVYNSDYGSFQFMINSSFDAGDPDSLNPGNVEGTAGGRNAAFRHENEIARPYLYQVTFDEYDEADPGTATAPGTTMAVTPTMHCGVAQFTYPAGSRFANVVLDQERASGKTTVYEDGTFEGYSDHTAFGSTRMYFCGRFLETPTAIANVGSGVKKVIQFGSDLESEMTVEMVFATSFLSQEQAWHSLELELGVTKTEYAESLFEETCDTAHEIWNEQLGVISGIEGATYEQLCTVYTGLYKMYSYPIFGGENTGTNENPVWKHMDVSEVKDSPEDTVISDGIIYYICDLWGMALTNFPALTLFSPNQVGDVLDGLLTHYDDGGWVPRWTRPGPSTSMIGTSSDFAFADAMVCGIEFDWEKAYESALKNALVYSDDPKLGRKQLDTATFLGYAYRDGSVLTSSELSWSLLNAQCDYGISQMARALGRTDDYHYFINKSRSYTLLYNPVDPTGKGNGGFLQPKDRNGSWSQSSFNPKSWWGPCVETNMWNSQFVQYDVNGLASLYGGRDVLERKLDDFFATEDDTTVNTAGKIHEQVEQRENKFGMAGMENQPSFHIPYMYNYTNSPYKTQELTREMLRRLFVGADIGQGYPGDEDSGQTSAWYILSALGLYRANPGSGEYSITSPLFSKAVINMDNGKKLTIIAEENSPENVYIQSLKLNGDDYNKNYIAYRDLADGGTLTFRMGSTPSDWGSEESAISKSSLTQAGQTPVYIKDITTSDLELAEGMDPLPQEAAASCAGATYPARLFDNNSLTYTTFRGEEKSVIYYNPDPQVVSMYTLTSSAQQDSAPSGFTLSGSNDGITWVELDKRTDVRFDWQRYTRSFSVATELQQAYCYFKLEFSDTEDIQVAEIELIGGAYVQPDWLSFYEEEVTLPFGESEALSVVVTPSDTAPSLLWSSSDESVATVDISGRVTAKGAGTVEITAAFVSDSRIRAVCEVTVTPTDKMELKKLHEEYKTLSSDQFTGNWPAFEAALDAAGQMLEDPLARQVEINRAAQELANAADALQPAVSLGDLNKDGVLSVSDVVALRQVIVSGAPSEEEAWLGDVDENGSVSVSDVVALRQRIVKG